MFLLFRELHTVSINGDSLHNCRTFKWMHMLRGFYLLSKTKRWLVISCSAMTTDASSDLIGSEWSHDLPRLTSLFVQTWPILGEGFSPFDLSFCSILPLHELLWIIQYWHIDIYLIEVNWHWLFGAIMTWFRPFVWIYTRGCLGLNTRPVVHLLRPEGCLLHRNPLSGCCKLNLNPPISSQSDKLWPMKMTSSAVRRNSLKVCIFLFSHTDSRVTVWVSEWDWKWHSNFNDWYSRISHHEVSNVMSVSHYWLQGK